MNIVQYFTTTTTPTKHKIKMHYFSLDEFSFGGLLRPVIHKIQAKTQKHQKHRHFTLKACCTVVKGMTSLECMRGVHVLIKHSSLYL